MSLKYRISNIGWYNFELLVQTLLKAVIGPGVTSFGGSKDRGRDATFFGTAEFPSGSCKWIGNWVFQVKYIDFEEQGTDSARSTLKAALRREIPSILRRYPSTDNYVFLTDVPLTASTRDELVRIAVEYGFKGNFAAIDGKEICQLLDIHKDVRKSFPQLLGLADLGVIVNRDLYARSRAYLEHWQPKLSTYVQTEAHVKALALLRNRHFIVLDGPPEAGKTTIAAALALIHASSGFEIIDVRSPNDVFRVGIENGHDEGQSERPKLFIADDAIGSISLEDARADAWSRDLPGILRKLSNKRLLVWTARRYILEEALAKSRLRDAIAEFPKPHEVLVEVGALTVMQKAEMLYNHAKQSNLSPENRELIRKCAAQIVNHSNFSPLRISHLTSVVMNGSGPKRNVNLTWNQLWNFFNNPGERWMQAFRSLSASEQLLLSSTLEFDGPVSLSDLRAAYELRTSRWGSPHLSFQECAARLDHSFLAISRSHKGEQLVAVQHPSLTDMLLLELRGNPDARKRYISLANSFALSRIISGIAELFENEAPPDHSVVPENEEEFDLLIGRLRGVSKLPLGLKDWEMLLTAAERLIPQKAHTGGEELATLLAWRLSAGTGSKFMEPVELDLQSFGNHWRGQILRALLEGFASRTTPESSKRFGAQDWARLLSRFYRLSTYLAPPIYLTFTREVCAILDNSIESIALANVISSAEPLVLKQIVSTDELEKWVAKLNAEAAELVEKGANFEWDDGPNEFDDWKADAEYVLGIAEDFSRWWNRESVAECIDSLCAVLDEAVRPHEVDLEYAREESLPESGPYWTVNRLFEDL